MYRISLSELKEVIPFYGGYLFYNRNNGSKYDLYLSWGILFFLLMKGWVETFPVWLSDFVSASVVISCSFSFLDSMVKNKNRIWIKRIFFSSFCYFFSLLYFIRSLTWSYKSTLNAMLFILFLLFVISRTIHEASHHSKPGRK
jgi:hypothetical protein